MAHRHNRRRVRSRSRKQTTPCTGFEASYMAMPASNLLHQAAPPVTSISLASHGVDTICHSHASSVSSNTSSTSTSTSAFRPVRILSRPSAASTASSPGTQMSTAASLMSTLQTTYSTSALPPASPTTAAEPSVRFHAAARTTHLGPAAERKAATIEAERLRLFGGVPGDDEGLCYKMLEVFGSLDYMR